MPPKKTLDIKNLKPFVKSLVKEWLLIWTAKQIPVLGDLIDAAQQAEMAQTLEKILQQQSNQAERMAILEALAATSPTEMAELAQEALKEAPASKNANAETQKLVTEMITQLPQAAARKTTATRLITTAQTRPISQAFYQDFIPTHRPQDWTGKALPHRSPPWTLHRLLGWGGFGAVWLAQNQASQQEAIKFCHADRLDDLQKESATLQKAQQLAHPNIVQLKEINLKQAPYWLAFEYVDGGDLLSLMQQRYLAWPDALRLFKGIVSGVAAAHQLKIVHRDLKPANVLLTRQLVPKIADFGLGREANADKSKTMAMGTHGYASPEQIAGKAADCSDDVYALGVIFWQLTTHTLEVPGLNFATELENSNLPDLAKELLKKCLLEKRGKRPKDADALLALVNQLPETFIHSPEAIAKRLEAEQQRTAAELAQQQALEKQQAQQAQAVKQEALKKSGIWDFMQSVLSPVKQSFSKSYDLATDWQQLQSFIAQIATQKQQIAEKRQAALAQLGPFNSKPRDEEFETTDEYHQRQANEKARYEQSKQAIQAQWDKIEADILGEINAAIQTLTQRRYTFEVKSLNGFNNKLDEANPKQGVLSCQAALRQVLPAELLALTASTPIQRDHAALYREHPDWFSLEVVLALKEMPEISVESAKLKIQGIGQFDSTVSVKREPDEEAYQLKREAQQRKRTMEAEIYLLAMVGWMMLACVPMIPGIIWPEVMSRAIAGAIITGAIVGAIFGAIGVVIDSGENNKIVGVTIGVAIISAIVSAIGGVILVSIDMGIVGAIGNVINAIRGALESNGHKFDMDIITKPSSYIVGGIFWVIVVAISNAIGRNIGVASLVAIGNAIPIAIFGAIFGGIFGPWGEAWSAVAILPLLWLWVSAEIFPNYLDKGETIFWSYALYASLAQAGLVSQHAFPYSPTIAMTIVIGAFTLFLERLWHKAVREE